jgi:hypothetical protein
VISFTPSHFIPEEKALGIPKADLDPVEKRTSLALTGN